ncbi:OmpA family protein [Brackiella oedipodis]|uniref:OmpA family protein n=1 Tax=Brackiella oedipodis TaxID=124225 RepID=UPI000686D81B|nr:OmpA family protein [Brackiella oedipodis]
MQGLLRITGTSLLVLALAACASSESTGPVSPSMPDPQNDNVTHARGFGVGIGTVTGHIQRYNWNPAINIIDNASTRRLGVTTVRQDDGTLRINIPESAAFDSSQYDLKASIFPVLDRIAMATNQHPEVRIKVVGHADSSGNNGINQPLSENRAMAVANYLTQRRGIVPTRVSTEGRAAQDPIADNKTPEGRRLNRRVEVFLYTISTR